MRRFYIISGSTLCIVIALLFLSRELFYAATEKHKERLSSTNAAQEFIAMRKGHPVINNSLENKVIVVNLWATWCGPCKEEIPELNAIAEQYRTNHEEVSFIAITDQSEQETKAFFEKEKFVFHQVHEGKDIQEYFHGLSSLMPVNSIPLTVVLNKKGMAELFLRGYSEENIKQLKDYLGKALIQPVAKPGAGN